MIADSQYAATLARSAAYAEMGPLAAAAARGQLSAEQIQTAIERATCWYSFWGSGAPPIEPRLGLFAAILTLGPTLGRQR